MFQSKAIKNYERKSSKLYLWWIETSISSYYYNFVHKFITNPIFQIKRLYGWQVNVFKHDYDFDGHCLYAIIGYKLKRIKKCLDNGHAIQEDHDMKALDLAIKLAGRLQEDNYDMIFWDRHAKKWGELKTWTTPAPEHGPGCSQYHSSRPNVANDEDDFQEKADSIASHNAAYAMMKREEKWLYSILGNHLRSWWD